MSRASIEVRDLLVRYGAVDAVRGVSFDVAAAVAVLVIVTRRISTHSVN